MVMTRLAWLSSMQDSLRTWGYMLHELGLQGSRRLNPELSIALAFRVRVHWHKRFKPKENLSQLELFVNNLPKVWVYRLLALAKLLKSNPGSTWLPSQRLRHCSSAKPSSTTGDTEHKCRFNN